MSTKQKHTPGPWKIDMSASFDCGYARRSAGIVGADGSIVIAFDPSEGEYMAALDPDTPDARLIAAAPELLEALKTCEAFLLSAGFASSDAYAEASAAIEKATGVSI